MKEQPLSELRYPCDVTGIDEITDGVQVEYKRPDGSCSKLKGRFLVGADGKRGYTRKDYLEAKGIEQVLGV